MAITLSVGDPIAGPPLPSTTGDYTELNSVISDAAAKIRTRPITYRFGPFPSIWLRSEPRRGPEVTPKVLCGLLVQIPTGIFRTEYSCRDYLRSDRCWAPFVDHLPVNVPELAATVDGSSGGMLIWCIGNAVHR